MNEYTYKVVKVHKVLDGDTIQATVDLGFGVYVDERFRLFGINTPELDGPENVLADKARVWLERKLKRSVSGLWVKSEKRDSFRRWLGTFLYQSKTGTEDINQTLITKGLAKPYKRKR